MSYNRFGVLLKLWNDEHDALTASNLELRNQLSIATGRAEEWEQRARRANNERAELSQKVEDLRVRLGEKMEKDAQGPDIMPMAEAKRPKEVAT